METINISPTTKRISLPWKWRPFKRRMLPGCELFSEGDAVLQSARKFLPLEDRPGDLKEQDHMNVLKESIPCSVSGCPHAFPSLLSYENHYNSVHRHTCVTCHRAFPSSYLLDIHIEENHDPLFSILTARQNMYQCLLESCSEKFATAKARRQHLIKVHHYPANFRFHRLPSAGSQRKTKQGCKPAVNTMETDSPPAAEQRKTATDKGEATTPSPVDMTESPSFSSVDTAESPSLSAVGIEKSPPLPCVQTGQSPCLPVVEMGESDCPSPPCGDGGQGGVRRGEAVQGGGVASEMEVCSHQPPQPGRVFVHRIPQNFSFGHGVGRGFQRPSGKKGKKKGQGHWHQRLGGKDMTTNIEQVNMKDLADSLMDAA